MNKNILIGYSGHSYVVIEAAKKRDMNIIGYADVQETNSNPYNLNYLGFEKKEDFSEWNKNYGFILGIGDNRRRLEVANFIQKRSEYLTTIVHPNSLISANVMFDNGSFVGAGAIINSEVSISDFVIVNTGSIVEHECLIGTASHVAPGVVLAGNVEVGERSFIGANSVIKQGVKIGDDVVVGAGTVVLKDIPNGIKVVGNPGRILL